MLQVLRQSGTAKEKEWAKRIEPVSTLPLLNFLARLLAEAARLSISVSGFTTLCAETSREKPHKGTVAGASLSVVPGDFCTMIHTDCAKSYVCRS